MARPRIGLALGGGSVRLLHHTGHCPGRLRLRLQRCCGRRPTQDSGRHLVPRHVGLPDLALLDALHAALDGRGLVYIGWYQIVLASRRDAMARVVKEPTASGPAVFSFVANA